MIESRTGGQAVVQTLRELGTPLVFTVSGNQILPIFDAAGDCGLRLIHMRHESAAAFAASAAAEIADQPGVVLTSAGPAFLAALTGLATVGTMEYPVLFLSGDSPVRNDGFGNFQELDQSAICNEICKASFRPVCVEAISGAIREAWNLARFGIPGPVHVALPADVLIASSTAESIAEAPIPPEALCPSEQLQACADRLRRARRPLVILRPSAARGANGELGRRLAEQLGVAPVITGAPRALADAKYLHLAPHYRKSDCALVVGPSDYALGFLDASLIASDGQVLLIDDENDPPPKRRVDMHFQSPVQAALRYLVEATASGGSSDPEWRRIWQERAPLLPAPEITSGAAHPLHIANVIRLALRPNDILVVDGGEFCQWMREGLRHLPNRWVWNSKFGVIGNAIPMALGMAAVGYSSRIIAIMGDGGAAYHLAEFETAARYHLPFVAVIGNDARWGAEWHLQVSRYGVDRTFETQLSAARYDVAAAGYGARGFHVQEGRLFGEALAAALDSREPACINVQIQSVRSPSDPP